MGKEVQKKTDSRAQMALGKGSNNQNENKRCFFPGRGGGGIECHIPILKNDFLKKHLESFPDCENVFCT